MNPQLLTLLQQNRLQEAQALCAKLCEEQPTNAQAQFMMSAICGQLGDFERSERYCRKAIKLNGTVPEAHFNLGVAQLRLGKLEGAIKSFKQALSLRPDFPASLNELGNAYQRAGRPDLAVAQHQKALQLQPQFTQALCNLGIAQLALGKTDAAAQSLQQAIATGPDFPDAYVQLAKARIQQGRAAEVESLIQEALARAPNHVEGLIVLAESHAQRDKPSAIEHCRKALACPTDNPELLARLGLLCKQLGLNEASISSYRKALTYRPNDPRLLSNRGVGLKSLGQIEESIQMHKRAIAIDPKLAGAHFNLGCSLAALFRYQEAERAYRKALKLDPDLIDAWNNLGNLMLLQGLIEPAIDCFEQVLARVPLHVLAASNRLLAMNYTKDRTQEAVYRAHREWGDSFIKATGTPCINQWMPGDRLRIGFVSPDFRTQSVAFFFKSLLSEAPSDSLPEIHCYSNTIQMDGTTEFIRKRVQGWRDIRLLDDAHAADLIRTDNIDILIDLTGHTSEHRLGLFAHRPARIQATYLGYPNTTGLPVMDYRITDRLSDPEENDKYYTEKLVRLDPCFLCYTPPDDAPAVQTVGSDASRPLSFGSFNNLAKITDDVLAAWAEILHRTPGSRLVIKNQPLADKHVAKRYLAAFKHHGIKPERLKLLAWLPNMDSHLAVYNQVDIALDTFPYNGTTTTCEALWMGRPVVSLAGSTHASRVGLSLLHQLSLDSFVATDIEDYIRIASDLADNLAGYVTEFDDLRTRMSASPLCDRAAYQQRFFDLLRRLQVGAL